MKKYAEWLEAVAVGVAVGVGVVAVVLARFDAAIFCALIGIITVLRRIEEKL